MYRDTYHDTQLCIVIRIISKVYRYATLPTSWFAIYKNKMVYNICRHMTIITSIFLKWNMYEKSVGNLVFISLHVNIYHFILTRKMFYYSFIQPYFEYCTSQHNLESLQILQTRAMRIVLRCHPRTHIHHIILNTLYLMDIYTNCKFQICCVMYCICTYFRVY